MAHGASKPRACVGYRHCGGGRRRPTDTPPARAQERATGGVPLIRDTEIEQLLRDYSAPILKAAGLAKQNIQIVILNDRSFNAFVMDGRHIFINAGALFEAKTPNEIIGVFAHETGHLAGGHLTRLREQLRKRRPPRSSPCWPASAPWSSARAPATAASAPRPSSLRNPRSSARCSPMCAPRKIRPTTPA